MHFSIVRNIIFLFCTFGSIAISHAQDLMARQAPVDRQMRAIDSVAMQSALKKEASATISDIYSIWSNDHVNAYKDVPKPSSFKIDLTGFTMPTPSRNITSRYGYRSAFRRNHYGLDIKVYTGDTIYAAFEGKIRIVAYDRAGYGYYIVMRHPNGLETVYGHLSKQLVAENEMVASGAPIGLGGSTGRSTGSHLHFETRLLGEPINPEFLFDFPNQDVTGDYYTWINPDYRSDGEDGIYNAMASSVSGKTSSSSSNRPTYHKVKKGESLYSIATSMGMTVAQLCSLNGIRKRSKLRPGQILKCR